MRTFREEMLRLAEELCPGDERLAELLRNATDAQERIAKEILERHTAAVKAEGEK